MKFDFDALRFNIDNIEPADGEMHSMLEVNENMGYTSNAIQKIKSTLQDITDILEELYSNLPRE